MPALVGGRSTSEVNSSVHDLPSRSPPILSARHRLEDILLEGCKILNSLEDVASVPEEVEDEM